MIHIHRATLHRAILAALVLLLAVTSPAVATPQPQETPKPQETEAAAAGDQTTADSVDESAEAADETADEETGVVLVPNLALAGRMIDRPAVGPRVDLGGEIAVGRATVRPRSGTAVHLLTAGDEPVGVLIAGPGRLAYRVEDRFSIPVARRNRGEGADLASDMEDGALVVGSGFDFAALWGWELGEWAAARALEDAGDSDAAFPQPLRNRLSGALFNPPSTSLLEEKGIASGGGRVYGLFTGGAEDVLLSIDPVVDNSEALYVVTGVSRYNVVQRGMSTLFAIADQPIGRQWWDRQGNRNPLVLEHQAVSLVNDEGDHVTSESTSRVRARRSGVSTWRAGVSSHFYWDRKLHPVTVEKVLLDGEPVDHLHQNHVLLVDLGRRLEAGEAVELTVVIEGDMAKRPNNDSYWRPVASWRPQMGLDGEYATYDITVRTPKPYIPFTSGETVERKEEDGFHVLRSEIDKPAHFPVVVAGKYHVFSDQQDGYTCNVATYAFGQKKPAQVLQGLFFSAAQIFEQFFGVPYPFDEVDVVEMNSWGWAQAPDGVIFITQEAYNPISDIVSRFYSQGINARFVHEVAHAWWGHVIKMDSWEEQWLTESFADYSAALAMEVMQPGKRGRREFNKILREWKSHTEQIGEGGSIYLANYLDSRDPTDQDNFDRYRLLYNKGPLVLHALRQELGRRLGSEEQGDRYFQALLRTFTTNFTNQYGETRHLVGILNQMTGDDWQPWFEKYVYGTETPEVEI